MACNHHQTLRRGLDEICWNVEPALVVEQGLDVRHTGAVGCVEGWNPVCGLVQRATFTRGGCCRVDEVVHGGERVRFGEPEEHVLMRSIDLPWVDQGVVVVDVRLIATRAEVSGPLSADVDGLIRQHPSWLKLVCGRRVRLHHIALGPQVSIEREVGSEEHHQYDRGHHFTAQKRWARGPRQRLLTCGLVHGFWSLQPHLALW